MDPKIRKQLIKILEEGREIPEDYKHILFPESQRKEYELVYAGKEREEDILAETMRVPLQPVKTFCNGQKTENGWMLVYYHKTENNWEGEIIDECESNFIGKPKIIYQNIGAYYLSGYCFRFPVVIGTTLFIHILINFLCQNKTTFILKIFQRLWISSMIMA